MQDGYDFTWQDLGDLEIGRPNLGNEVPIIIYRLLQYSFRDVLGKELGQEAAREIFVKAGQLAGRQFCQNVLDTGLPFNEFIAALENQLIRMKVGILRVEEANLENLRFTLTIAEDLDCSGLPLHGNTVCDFDEGFLAGILQEYTGNELTAKEVDCWATGERTCRFIVKSATD